MTEEFLASESNHLPQEAQIVELAKNNEQAFEQLYNFYLPKIYGYIYKRVGNKVVAEDLTSETFLKVFCNLKKYQYQGYAFSAWLYRIATNNLIDYYRRKGRQQEVALPDEDILENAERLSLPETIRDPHEIKNIEWVLAKMPKRYARVINLRFFAELTPAEIALTLKISENNARVLIHRALQNFKKKYKKYGF